MVKSLVNAVEGAVKAGVVLDAPLPVRIFPNTIREPDVMYFAPGSEPSDVRSYPTRVDLAMEVVSEGVDARRRDYEHKRSDYAKAGISGYWIVDPDERKILVLTLDAGSYRTHGEFHIGDQAIGKLITDLQVDVAELFFHLAAGWFFHRSEGS